jgi:glyceraldehyde-3-phosphate dehydrogenase/erythrose-4-phosphate dehydrogenase
VPAAAASIKNVQTGVVTPTTANMAGLYDVPFLQPGTYTVTVSKTGFRNVVRDNIALQIQTLEVNATLEVGVASQEVVVSATPSLVETETSDQHVDLTTQTVITAPVVGSDWRNEMTQLIPA